VQAGRSLSYQATPAGPARPAGGKTPNKPHSKAGTDMENQPARRHQIMTLSRYGRPFRMLRRALSVTNSRMAEERTLRPNRVDDLRPMSHPTAGCAAITLEPETWKRSANMRQSGRSDSVSRTAHRHRYLRVSAAVVCEWFVLLGGVDGVEDYLGDFLANRIAGT
jgi:hypothetical protein